MGPPCPNVLFLVLLSACVLLEGSESAAGLQWKGNLDVERLKVGFLSGIQSRYREHPKAAECIVLASDQDPISEHPDAGDDFSICEKDRQEDCLLETQSPAHDPRTPNGKTTIRLMQGSRVVGKKNMDKFLALPRSSGGKVLCRWCAQEVSPPRRTFCSAECVHEYRLRTDQSYIRSCVLERDNGICALCARNAHILFVAAASFACDARMELSAEARARVLKACRSRRRKHADKTVLLAILHASGAGSHTPTKQSKKGSSKGLARLSVADLRKECARFALREWSEPGAAAEASRADFSQGAAASSSGGEALPGAVSDALPAPLGAQIWALLTEELAFRGALNALQQARALSPGQFWQADHIVPVAEGGGLCCLENFRTLCTPCHAECTRRLRARLAAAALREKDEARHT